jgi:hypothetical protein
VFAESSSNASWSLPCACRTSPTILQFHPKFIFGDFLLTDFDGVTQQKFGSWHLYRPNIFFGVDDIWLNEAVWNSAKRRFRDAYRGCSLRGAISALSRYAKRNGNFIQAPLGPSA